MASWHATHMSMVHATTASIISHAKTIDKSSLRILFTATAKAGQHGTGKSSNNNYRTVAGTAASSLAIVLAGSFANAITDDA